MRRDLAASFSWQRLLVAQLVLAVVYYLAARLGMLMEFKDTQASPVWPPTGIALAAGLVYGRRVLPGVALGAFLANLAFAHLHRHAGDSELTVLAHIEFAFQYPTEAVKAGAISIGNLLEAMLGTWLVQRFSRAHNPFKCVRGTMVFSWAVPVACAASATVGVTSVCLAGVPWTLFGSIWLTWWLGDVAGGLVLAPAVTILASEPIPRYTPGRAFAGLLALAGLVLLASLTFFELANIPLLHAQAYLLLPCLIVVVYRLGRAEGSVSVALLCVIAVWGTWAGTGPFTRGDANQSFLLLVGFVSVMSITVLVLGAALEELRELAHTLEQRVELRTHELARSNEELERFAYIASHDLKSPLRAIENLSSWIEEDLAGVAAGGAQENLALLRNRTRRMQGLVDGLLEYSLAGKAHHQVELVDVNQLLRDVTDLLSPPLGFSVEAASALPTLTTTRAPLEHVLVNLLGNAIKHHHQPSVGVVKVSVEDQGGHLVFEVADNGPGIPEKFQQEVFVMFKTLRSRDEVEGTGLGLTLARKLVEAAGGELHLESREGQGARFRFSWPKSAPADASEPIMPPRMSAPQPAAST